MEAYQPVELEMPSGAKVTVKSELPAGAVRDALNDKDNSTVHLAVGSVIKWDYVVEGEAVPVTSDGIRLIPFRDYKKLDEHFADQLNQLFGLNKVGEEEKKD